MTDDRWGVRSWFKVKGEEGESEMWYFYWNGTERKMEDGRNGGGGREDSKEEEGEGRGGKGGKEWGGGGRKSRRGVGEGGESANAMGRINLGS